MNQNLISELLQEFMELGAAAAQSQINTAVHQAQYAQLLDAQRQAAGALKKAMDKNQELHQALAIAKAPELAPTEEVVRYFDDSPQANSPLEEFEILSLLPIQIGDFFLSFTNSSLFMLLTLGLVLLLILLVTKKLRIIEHEFGKKHSMSINSFSHYSFFLGLFVAFTYNKKQPPAFGAAPAFLCILSPFLGLLFGHIPNNLSNYSVLTANAPVFYQISGTWSNHEGSILLWCGISSFYRFLLCCRGRPPPTP